MIETQDSINAWIRETFGEAGSNASVAARANQEMSELMMALAVDDDYPKAAEEAADIVIILYRLAERRGVSLHDAINAKMAVNRRRRWNVAHGHGYHVKAETERARLDELDAEVARLNGQIAEWSRQNLAIVALEVKERKRAEEAEFRLETTREALRDAAQQIRYLHEKFSETGSGNAVLARIDAELAQAGEKP